MVFSLVCLVFLLCNSFPLIYSLNDEGFTLLSFKHSIKEDPEGSLSNWNSSDENPCSWNGITCRESKVVSLTIPKKKLVGFLPSVLGSLSSLRRINLKNNKLFGTLPVELFNAQSLQTLVLYGNFLSGFLPSEIGNLWYLQTLDLSQNLLNGSIPKSLIQCKRLRTLVLSQNSFTGNVPDGLGSGLIALEKLDFSFNKLSGSIPSDMGNLLNLQEVMDLSHNLFSGPIPESLGNLPERVYIDLTYNNLSGLIPQSGDLRNRGFSTFAGNPGLCGPPLKNPCPLTSNYTDSTSDRTRDLSKKVVIAMVASDVVGIFLIGLLLSYCFVRFCSCREGKDDDSGVEFEKGTKRSKDCCLCFRKNAGSRIQSKNIDQYDLVAFDTQVDFDLDELLKASAFVLGKSGIGIVYKVVLEDGFTLAVRRLGEGGSQRFKEFQSEVEAIAKIRHVNIVKLRAYYWSVDEKLLIYDYAPNGNLATAIHGYAGMLSFTPLPWFVRLRIMQGVAKGLAYLHEFSPEEYVHGDLKPENILLGQNMEPQIADFGLEQLASIVFGSSKLQQNQMASETQQHQQNTPSQFVTVSSTMSSRSSYQAPEALKVIQPSQKCDVYSYGVILLEIISGKPSIVQVGTSEMDLVTWIKLCIEENKPLTDVLDPFLVREAIEEDKEIVSVLKIALACVQTNPARRISMRKVVDIFDRLTATYG